MDRIVLSEQFYEDEVREGFYIPACIKQAWGAQIQIFNEVDRVCSKLGIKYFADMGTFLGAVRHGGYIPWDDDFDICMLRDDYIRFLDEGASLLPDGFTIYNLKNRKEHTKFFANIVAKSRICFEPEHLEKYHGFPYIASIDLFILDYVSNDETRREMVRIKSQYVIKVSDEIREGRLVGDERKEVFRYLKDNLGISVPPGLDDNEIRHFLDIKAEELFAAFVGEKSEAERVVYMMPYGIKNIKFKPARDYQRQVDMPFESGTVPVALLYDEALRYHFRNYMKIIKEKSGHDYPFFEKSREQLKEVLDFELPEYRVDADELIKKYIERREQIKRYSEKGSDDTYKAVVNECLANIQSMIILLSDGGNTDDIMGLCGDIQKLAIDLGTYMEAVKGEGYDIVILLEEFCEELFILAVADSKDKAEESIANVYGQLRKITDKVNSRKEVVFLPFKSEYWDVFNDEYKKSMDDPDTDVYVVPIPYYYKDYLGRLHDMQYYPEKYPADIHITHYDEYDFALRHPDTIYIQCPYDAENIEISLPPFFYSDKLLEYTDRLVYIPWFRTADFTRDNGRDYSNMKYYCTVPGVINADRVILHSETLRNTYIEKLCDFAGEKTRKLWESKIIVSCDHDEKYEPVNSKDSIGIKTMLYFPDFSEMLQYGTNAVKKIKTVAEVCEGSRDEWKFVFLRGKLIDEVLKELDRNLYNEYEEAVRQISADGLFEVVNEKETDHKTLVDRCSVYYGDGGRLAHLFRCAGKPVKIQDYNEADLIDVNSIYECADF